MNTDYSVGSFRIRFDSRARRRWLVVFVYAALGIYDFAWVPMQGRDWLVRHAAWLAIGLLITIVALMIVFTWLTVDIRRRGDERETHRREHAYARAYYPLGSFLTAGFLAWGLFQGPNPITPLLAIVVQAYVTQLPLVLLTAAGMVYITLPRAILLWTEPDMEEAEDLADSRG
jgi:hypothetical protein